MVMPCGMSCVSGGALSYRLRRRRVEAFMWEVVLVLRPAGLSGGRKMC